MGFKILKLDTDSGVEKRKICVTGNIKDAQWFEKIAVDVLDWYDCEVYMADKFAPNEDPEMHCNYLDEMSLVIMVVTNSFLTEESRARNAEFPAIWKKRIPMLPIMVEEGLERTFNSVCGDIHLLNYNTDDYKNRMLESLNRIFVNSDLQSAIQNAFYGECFLSYRKKDREHALKLIHTIRQIAFCREISIWFDDFLILGEDYSDEIDEHLSKSDFFVLAVTPNLLEPENYVLKTEYPRAVELNKKIIPVELVPTDREELLQKYPGLPECIKIDDIADLEKALWEVKKDLNEQESAETPEKNYLLGLAYLRGICAEQDCEYGVSLLKKAAMAGNLKAMKELGYIYCIGRGVMKNTAEAFVWLERYLEVIQSNHQENDELWQLDYAVVLRDLCDANMEMGNWEDALDVVTQLLDFNKQYPDILWTQSSTGMAAVYIRAGIISYRMEKYDYADAYYNMAKEEMEKLLRLRCERTELSLNVLLLQMQGRLQLALYEKHNAHEYLMIANMHFEKALVAVNELVESYHDISDFVTMVDVLEDLGYISQTLGNDKGNLNVLSKGRSYLRKAYEVMRIVTDETKQEHFFDRMVELAYKYAFCTAVVAHFYEQKGDMQQAESLNAEAKSIMAAINSLNNQ